MANRRYINLEKYGISLERYKELSAFAMQYREWGDALKHEISPALIDKIKLINDVAEQCSVETVGDNGLAEYIIKNVTEERPYYYLKDIMRMPYRDKTFYAARQRFYILLNKRKA